MVNPAKFSLEKFERYCSEYRVPGISDPVHKQYHIEVHNYTYNYKYVVDAMKYENVFIRESVSDYITGLFLLRNNMTKASMIVLRGSVENFMRFLCDVYSNRPDIIYSTAVTELFEVNKSHFEDIKLIPVCIGQLYSLYGDLCSYSHSALEEHQSLYQNLKSIIQDDDNDLKVANRNFRRAYQDFLKILYEIFYNVDNKYRMDIDHTFREYFVELIPVEVREEISSF